MKKFATLLTLFLFLSGASTAWAHGGNEGAVDASTLVQQAMAVTEGTGDKEMIKTKIKQAIKANDEGSVDERKLTAALAAADGDMEKTRRLLAESLGEDPRQTPLLSLESSFSGSGLEYLLMVLAVISVAGGLLIIRPKEGAASA